VIHIHFQEVFFISTMLTLLEKKFEIVAEWDLFSWVSRKKEFKI
jgi:hypothetical protein